MLYKKVLILTLFLSHIYASSCSQPAVAYDSFSTHFRYGCFCGRDYPNIEHTSKKSYKHLNLAQRQELITQYQQIDAYDDIDQLCKEHDICYISEGKEAKVCNATIYTKLRKIEKKFRDVEESNSSTEQCKNLAYDIGSVFHTIFSPADDENSFFDMGMLMLNGVITTMNKMFQESVDIIDNEPRYPSEKQKCLLKSIQD
jgi:hypothetical protein